MESGAIGYGSGNVEEKSSSRQDAKAQRKYTIQYCKLCHCEEYTMKENEIARIVVDTSLYIHQQLGPGLLESVYETVLAHCLEKRGLSVARQVPVPIIFEGISMREGFRADIIVENLVVLELKSVETIHPVHKKQLQTYLRLANKKLGLLLNFGMVLMKDGICRLVNGL